MAAWLGRDWRLDELAILPALHGHHPTSLLVVHGPGRIAHPERPEDARGDELVQRLAGKLRHDLAEDGGASPTSIARRVRATARGGTRSPSSSPPARAGNRTSRSRCRTYGS